MPRDADLEGFLLNSCPAPIPAGSQVQNPGPFPFLDLSPNPKLLSQGWDRRFMVGPDRVDETNQLYRELGYEVLNEPVIPSELNEICKACQTLACSDYVVIYTRKGIGANSKRP